MRTMIVVACLATTVATAHANGVVELGGALAFPVSDSNWTNTADTSPELAVRAGTGNENFAGLVGLAWTPVRTQAQGGSSALGSVDFSAQRFRILANLELRHRLAPKFTLSGRVGAGIDIMHESASITILGNTASNSDTNVGFAIDVAAGGWYRLGETTEVGIEVAVPIGYHSKTAQPGNAISFDYTQVDIEMWLAVRLMSL
jgi:hypothetical protein